MAITIATADPAALLAKIKKAIDENHIRTWSYDADEYFTHTPTQWNEKAWLKSRSETDGLLVMGIVGRAKYTTKVGEYAVYHSAFIEMLLNHFDKDFTGAVATALPVSEIDYITTEKNIVK